MTDQMVGSADDIPVIPNPSSSCGCESRHIVYYACAGGSNVGYASFEAARSLVKANKGKMACLAGVGGHVPTMVKTALEAEVVVCIDGCGIACARKAVEHVGAKPHIHVVATDLGIKKKYELDATQEDVDKVRQKVEEGLAAL